MLPLMHHPSTRPTIRPTPLYVGLFVSGCSAVRGHAFRPVTGAITASWIAASIIGMLSTGLSAQSHQRSKERRANFKRVLFQRQFTDKLHDAIFDEIGFNADP
jgi:hypothetical protein